MAHLAAKLCAQAGKQLVFQRADTRSAAVRMSFSRFFSSWVIYRSPLTKVCLRM